MISYVSKMFTVLDFLSFFMLFPNCVKENQAYVTSGWPKAGESEGQGKPCGFSLGSWMAGWSGPLLSLGTRGRLLCLAFQRHMLVSIDSIQSFRFVAKIPHALASFLGSQASTGPLANLAFFHAKNSPWRNGSIALSSASYLFTLTTSCHYFCIK